MFNSISISIQAVHIACFLFLSYFIGFPYGETGDPSVYAAQFINPKYNSFENNEPIYLLVIRALTFFINESYINPKLIVFLGFTQVFLSFYFITLSFWRSVFGMSIFAFTPFGFLVTFNLYRMSLALFIFSFIFYLLRRTSYRYTFSLFFAGLVHNIFLVFLIFSKKYLWITVIPIFFILFYFGFLTKFDFYYQKLTKNVLSFNIFFPITLILNTIILYFSIKYKEYIVDSQLIFILKFLYILQVLCILFGFNLGYERVSIFFTFLFVAFFIETSVLNRTLPLFFLYSLITLYHFILKV